MKIPFQSCSRPTRFLGIALSLAGSLFACGALMVPVVAAAENPVVDQQPLTIQPSIPPDVVLMLDDSGSMNADYMPDYDYLTSKSNDAMVDANNNGVYYNPVVTYTPPPHADGSSYTSQTDITAVTPNGINDMPPTESGLTGPYDPVDLTNYDGKYECDHSQNCGLNTDGSPKGHIYFSASVQGKTAATYSKTATSATDCQAVFDRTPGAFGTITFNNGVTTTGSGNCTFQYYPVYHYFQYSTGPATAPVVHYVASTNNDGNGCGDLNTTTTPTCVLDTTAGDGTNGAPAGITVGQNIANWFAYYHTRMLMAQSGLMTAFSSLNSDFRVGFGSINGRNAAFISNVPDAYPFYTNIQPNNYLAGVAPFGTTSGDTSTTSGISRFNFWTWVAGETAWGNTPLRQALDAVGTYYSDTSTSKAWNMMSSDPGYVAGDTTQVACRQAYTILTTDGFWSETYPNSAYAGFGNADGVAGTTVTGPNNQSYTYSPVGPYSDTYSDTLADVAMHYWETDLQPDIDNEVPVSTDDADPAFWQHMVTFTIGLGLGSTPDGITGTAPNGDNPPTTEEIFDWAGDGGGTSSQFAISNFAWPQPGVRDIHDVADLEHAGVNGHGGFFSAATPQDFVSGLEATINQAEGRVGTGASLAANSTQLTTASVIYQSTYFTSSWYGNLKAFSINSVDGTIATAASWQSAQEMPSADARDVQTYNPQGTTYATQFVAFKNSSTTTTNPDGTSSTATAPPSLSSTQLSALGSDATTQENIVNYLRGDHSLEVKVGGTLRTRYDQKGPTGGYWTLGDIVDSQPVYAGPPDPNEFVNQSFLGTLTDSSGDVPFYTWAVGSTDSSGNLVASDASKRTPLIFVAANDGMLHAFDSTSGAEVYAYLPGAVITNGIKDLSDPSYGSTADPHQFYNDGQLTVADAYVKLSQLGDTSPEWHTIVVGTTGRGPAKAVYALAIDDSPTATQRVVPLWERSAGDGLSGSDYIGQMTGKPVIAQTNYTAASGSTAASSTWSVLMGNGYNSTKGVAALLQFDLATGTLSVHTTTDTTTGNGLAAPVAWMDNASGGVSDMAYAGDLHGNVWSFQLNDSTGANGTSYTTSTGVKLFTATDASGNVQPITAGILAGQDPATSNVWLFFGTGEYLNSTDLTSTKTQSWYGLIVQSCTTKTSGNTTTTTCAPVTTAIARSKLTQRTITGETAGGSGTLPARSISSQVVDTTAGTNDMTGKSGWYLDLVGPNATATDPAERMVDPNEFQGSLLIGVTRIPKVTDVCNPSGSGWIMAVNPFTGAAPSGDFFDVNNDGYVNAGDRVSGSIAAGVGFSSLPNAPIFVGGIMETSFDNGTMSKVTTAGTVGTVKRVTWRELVN